MPYSAIKIANAFIEEARSKGGVPLTPLQLIKLTYIAHGWGFVFLDDALLSEPVQAWQYGPVVPSLYYSIRQYKAAPVVNKILGDADPQDLSSRVSELISAIYDRYKHLSGTQLSALTHKSNTPWSITWERKGQNAVIPNELISAHYKEKYQEQLGNDRQED